MQVAISKSRFLSPHNAPGLIHVYGFSERYSYQYSKVVQLPGS